MKILNIYSSSKGAMKHIALDFSDLIDKYYFVKNHELKSGGILNYLMLVKELIKKKNDYYFVAHYGLIGFACFLSFGKYILYLHGSDIWNNRYRYLSIIAILRSKYTLVASKSMLDYIPKSLQKKCIILPMPVRNDLLCNKNRIISKDSSKKRVLFAGTFDRMIKNPHLAIKACSLIHDVHLYEYKDVEKEDKANFLINFDALLITSHHESGPLSFLEALCVGLPIVTVNVGIVHKYEECEIVFICEAEPTKISLALQKAFLIKSRESKQHTIKDRSVEQFQEKFLSLEF